MVAPKEKGIARKDSLDDIFDYWSADVDGTFVDTFLAFRVLITRRRSLHWKRHRRNWYTHTHSSSFTESAVLRQRQCPPRSEHQRLLGLRPLRNPTPRQGPRPRLPLLLAVACLILLLFISFLPAFCSYF
jgi:hypothetical protein